MDTQLWERARLVSIGQRDPLVPNGVVSFGHNALKQTENVSVEREFRPQTRALTRARVKNHCPSETGVILKPGVYSACDSTEQASSSNSPTQMDSPTATRSPVSPLSDRPSLKREPIVSLLITHVSDGSCTASGEPVVSFGPSLSSKCFPTIR